MPPSDGDQLPPRRKSMRAESWRYHWPGPYFVTIVINGRFNRLGEVRESAIVLSDVGEMTEHYWLELPNKYPGLSLDEFVIMPNHFHGILQLPPGEYDQGGRDRTLGQVIGWFKTMTTNAYIRGVKTKGWPRYNGSFWQPEYWDHISRGSRDMDHVREYIAANPTHWEQDPESQAAEIAW